MDRGEEGGEERKEREGKRGRRLICDNRMLTTRSTVLLVTFFIELFSGFLVLWVALFKVQKSEDPESLKVVRKGVQHSHESMVLQLVLMGLVNIFSAVLCLMIVSFVIAGYTSWYLTYIQWGMTTPFIIIILCLICSIDFNTTMVLAFLDAMVMVCGAMASLFKEKELKYGWFAFGSFFFLLMFTTILRKKKHLVALAHKKLQANVEKEQQSIVLRDKQLSDRLIVLTLTTWSLYPITWLIEETKVIDSSDADIMHSVFAAFAKVSFGFVLAYYRARLVAGARDYGILAIPSLLNRSIGRQRSPSSLSSSSPSTPSHSPETTSFYAATSPATTTPPTPTNQYGRKSDPDKIEIYDYTENSAEIPRKDELRSNVEMLNLAPAGPSYPSRSSSSSSPRGIHPPSSPVLTSLPLAVRSTSPIPRLAPPATPPLTSVPRLAL